MSQLLATGVIPETVYPKNNPIRKIVKEILSGRTDSYTFEEMEHIVNRRYFGFDSLVSLTEQEESFLRSNMVDSMLHRFNKGDTRKFLESVCYRKYQKKGWVSNVYTKEALERDRDSSESHIMTNEEKLLFLEDPQNLESRWHELNLDTPFASMGYRNFDEYPISRDKNFATMLQRLRAVGGKRKLCVLDLGGGVGLALWDIKQMYPELITYNATRDEEFSHYPTDFHVVGFMERMPLALQGKIDFIFSNMATRYFAYSDLVIQCCVLMLAKGGIMDVFFFIRAV